VLWLKGGVEERRKVMVKKGKETKKGEKERRREKKTRETAEMEKLEAKLLVCFNECRFSRPRIERLDFALLVIWFIKLRNTNSFLPDSISLYVFVLTAFVPIRQTI